MNDSKSVPTLGSRAAIKKVIAATAIRHEPRSIIEVQDATLEHWRHSPEIWASC